MEAALPRRWRNSEKKVTNWEEENKIKAFEKRSLKDEENERSVST